MNTEVSNLLFYDIKPFCNVTVPIKPKKAFKCKKKLVISLKLETMCK